MNTHIGVYLEIGIKTELHAEFWNVFIDDKEYWVPKTAKDLDKEESVVEEISSKNIEGEKKAFKSKYRELIKKVKGKIKWGIIKTDEEIQ